MAFWDDVGTTLTEGLGSYIDAEIGVDGSAEGGERYSREPGQDLLLQGSENLGGFSPVMIAAMIGAGLIFSVIFLRMK